MTGQHTTRHPEPYTRHPEHYTRYPEHYTRHTEHYTRHPELVSGSLGTVFSISHLSPLN